MACSILLTEVRMPSCAMLAAIALAFACAVHCWSPPLLVGCRTLLVPLLQNDEFLRLVINSIRNDITGCNEPFQCLALNFIGSGEFLELSAHAACRWLLQRSTFESELLARLFDC